MFTIQQRVALVQLAALMASRNPDLLTVTFKQEGGLFRAFSDCDEDPDGCEYDLKFQFCPTTFSPNACRFDFSYWRGNLIGEAESPIFQDEVQAVAAIRFLIKLFAWIRETKS